MEFNIKEFDQKLDWENFILKYSPQSYFQSWNWGEVNKRKGLHLKRVGLFKKKECIGIAQIATVSAKRGTFLHVRNGPILKNWDVKNFSLERGVLLAAIATLVMGTVNFLISIGARATNPLIINWFVSSFISGSLGFV